MTMRALKSFDYNRRQLKAGDTFEPASDDDARDLALVEFAAEVDEEPRKKKKQHYKTRHMQAAEDE